MDTAGAWPLALGLRCQDANGLVQRGDGGPEIRRVAEEIERAQERAAFRRQLNQVVVRAVVIESRERVRRVEEQRPGMRLARIVEPCGAGPVRPRRQIGA